MVEAIDGAVAWSATELSVSWGWCIWSPLGGTNTDDEWSSGQTSDNLSISLSGRTVPWTINDAGSEVLVGNDGWGTHCGAIAGCGFVWVVCFSGHAGLDGQLERGSKVTSTATETRCVAFQDVLFREINSVAGDSSSDQLAFQKTCSWESPARSALPLVFDWGYDVNDNVVNFPACSPIPACWGSVNNWGRGWTDWGFSS